MDAWWPSRHAMKKFHNDSYVLLMHAWLIFLSTSDSIIRIAVSGHDTLKLNTIVLVAHRYLYLEDNTEITNFRYHTHSCSSTCQVSTQESINFWCNIIYLFNTVNIEGLL